MAGPGHSRTLAFIALFLFSLLGFTAESEPAETATELATDTRATDGRAPEETSPGRISSKAPSPSFQYSLAKPAESEPRETQSAVSTQAHEVPAATSGDTSAESIPEAFEYSSREAITPPELPQSAEPRVLPAEEPQASPASSNAEEASYSRKLAAAPPKPEEEGLPQEPSYTETFETPMTLTEPEEVETGQEGQERDETGHDAHPESPPLSAHDASPPPSLRDEEEQPVFELGQRVLIGSVMAGSVRYVGRTHFAEGLWVGVELDLPKGINDGSKDGHRYFSCEPDHGLFAPPSKVSLLDEEEEEEASEGEGEESVEEEIESSVDKSGDQFWEEGVAAAEGDEPAETREPRDSYTPDFEPSDKEEPTAEQSDKETTLGHASAQDFEGNIPEQLPVRGEDHPVTKATELQLPALSSDIAEDSSVIPLVAPEEEAPAGQSPVLPIVPAFAPPPEFAEGASRESSEEREVSLPLLKNTEAVVSELTQDLSNEAFDTVHRIWRNKHVGKQPSSEVVVYKNKEIPLTLEKKADKITDELLALLLQSETNLVCNIHSAKTSHPPEPPHTEARSPKNRELPARLVIPPFNIESSPPPISPPLIFQGSPPPTEFSPPSSPPRHLSQASAARVAAGEKSPFLAVQQEPGSPPHSRKVSIAPRFLERSSSLETITELMESVKFRTSQSVVPSERKHVDRVVEEAWNAVKNVGLDCLHSATFQCPREVLSLFRDTKCNPAEDKCRTAYLQLVYMLSIQTLQEMYPPSTPRQVWAHPCAMGGPLTRRRSHDEAITLEQVQKKVFAILMKGQLPPQLPAVKFLHGMKVGSSLSPLPSPLSCLPPQFPLETVC